MQHHESSSPETSLAHQAELLKLAAKRPHLSTRLLLSSRRLFERFQRFYQALCKLPRPLRRRLQRRLALSLTGVALALAMSHAPVAYAATITVTTNVPDISIDGQCSLIEALFNAHFDNQSGSPECAPGSGADIIVLAGNTYTVTRGLNEMGTGLPLIETEITIEGNGATIQRDPADPDQFRFFEVTSSGNLTLDQVTLTGGAPAGTATGGAIYNGGVLTINRSTIRGNSSASGGGLYNKGQAAISDSTFSNNTSTGNGGGINNSHLHVLNFSNSTLSGNSSGGLGGGLFNMGTVTLRHSTVTGNSGSSGGGIRLGAGFATFDHLLVSGNTAGSAAEISNAVGITDLGYNLVGHSGLTNAQAFSNVLSMLTGPGDRIATSDGTHPTALNSILDPMLALNGGATLNHALVSGSPALDIDSNTVCPLAADQRGVARPQGIGCDAGAFEVAVATPTATASATPEPPTATPTNTPEPPTATATATPGPVGPMLVTTNVPDINPGDGQCSLIEAIVNANNDAATYADCPAGSGADTITLAADSIHTLTSVNNGANGLPVIASAITIEGNGATIQRDPADPDQFRLFELATSSDLTLKNLTLAGGAADTGGAIFNAGTVALNSSTVSNNQALRFGGGGILNLGTLTLTDSTVSGNQALNNKGGGVDNQGPLTLVNSTVSGNRAGQGGGIFNFNMLTLTHSTVSGNQATPFGGGGILNSFFKTVILNQSLISGNTAVSGGAEIYALGTVTSNGYNLVGHSGLTSAQAFFHFVPSPNDRTATSDGTHPTALTAILNTTLASNGGATFTHALVQCSPALDASPTGPVTDQRGVTRPQGAAFDIGAFELVPAPNTPPMAADDNYTTAEDSPLTIAASGALGNDGDADCDTLATVLVSGPAHGMLTLNTDGPFSYTPAADFSGADSFTYKANDSQADSNLATVTLTVTPVNDAPLALADSYSTNEDTPLVVPAPGVLGNDTDVENNALTATLVDAPAHGTLTLGADGSFTYTPAANFNGTDSFTYKANDGQADSSVVTVALTINAVNDPPLAGNDSYTTNEDTLLSVPAPSVVANDSDPVEGSPLSAVLVAAPAHGTLTLNPDGSFTYTPALDFSGADSFTYKANDGGADSNIATVNLTVVSALNQIEQLSAGVQALVNNHTLNGGQGNALTAKLAAAKAYLAQGQTAQAISSLQDFINQVNALINAGILSPAQGQLLIAAANAVIHSLGG